MAAQVGLYVPGNRPDRFAKAASSGADLVVIDLEDAVPAQDKARAREAVMEWFGAGQGDGSPDFQVRVNPGVPEDLDAVREIAPEITIRLPKVQGPRDVDAAVSRAPGHAVVALLETAQGILAAPSVAGHEAVVGLAVGESDLRSEIGAAPAVKDFARMSVVFAARAAGLPAPLLSVYPAITDLQGLEEDTRRGLDMGFGGRMAIHPRQIASIRRALHPAGEDVAWATEVVSALPDGGVARLADGQMVDPAMLGRARAILERAGVDAGM